MNSRWRWKVLFDEFFVQNTSKFKKIKILKKNLIIEILNKMFQKIFREKIFKKIPKNLKKLLSEKIEKTPLLENKKEHFNVTFINPLYTTQLSLVETSYPHSNSDFVYHNSRCSLGLLTFTEIFSRNFP